MLDRLANLAGGHPKRVLVASRSSSSLVAGVLGAGVADRLDPYGADDPDTESVHRRGAARGRRLPRPQAIVLIEGVDLNDARAARERVEEVARPVADVDGVRAVTGFLETRLAGVRLARRRVDLPRGPVRRRPRTTSSRTRRGARRRARGRGRTSSSAATRSPSSRSTRRSSRTCSAPSCSRSRSSSCSRCSSSAASSRRRCRCSSAAWRSSRPCSLLTVASELTLDLDLRAQPRDRARPRARDRLQPVRRLALPRGDREVRAPGWRRCGGRWRRPAARCSSPRSRSPARSRRCTVFPQRFLYSMGIGGALVALLAAAISLTVLPAVLALLGERVNSLAPAFLQRRAEADARPATDGLLVPALAHRDARPGPDRARQRGLPDRARDPVLQHQLHLGRRPGPARGRERPPGRRRRFAPSSRPSATRRSSSRSRAAAPRPRSVAARGRPTLDGRRRGQAAAAARAATSGPSR